VLNSSSSELKGNVKANVHYFEDGNVQLHTSIDHSENIKIDNSDATAKRVVESISKFETEFQNNLEEMYVNMHRTTFKAMRRFLPISGQKFMWTSAAHSLASEVSK
jgi:capping protein alpha